jgi:RNA polymerase sigma-70 factor (ECF subfamily)
MGAPQFTTLIRDHAESLYRYALWLSGSSADADDLTQETYALAQARFSQLRDQTLARPWLFRILRNVYLKQIRRRNLAPTVSLDGMDVSAAASVDDVDREQLYSALQSLPEEFRTAIVLFYFQELKYREIADVLQIPIGTVMSRISRAKELLRSRLSTPQRTRDPHWHTPPSAHTVALPAAHTVAHAAAHTVAQTAAHSPDSDVFEHAVSHGPGS